MRSAPVLRRITSASVLALSLVCVTACSDAETPNAGFSVEETDGGTAGGRDEPCVSGRCNSEDLVCVSQGSGQNQTLTCRLLCDANLDDPCGFRSTCRTLENTQQACLPAGLLDEACPCDEGFACVNLASSVCKIACTMGVDGGPDTCADEEGTCFAFRAADGGTRDDGVCLLSDPTPDDGGVNPGPDAGAPDAGAADAGTTDGGATDGGTPDGG